MKKFLLIVIIFITAGSPKSGQTKTKILTLFNQIISNNAKKIGTSEQIILVINQKLTSRYANVYTFQKTKNHWQMIFPTIKATIGKKGFALVDQKREGDLKAPTGIFKLILTFGYPSSIKTKMPYKQSTKNDFWVDDPNSPQYNTWVTGKPNAKSFERMKRKDHLYKYGIVVKYNLEPIVKGRGSAMFFHIWRRPGAPTAGCVAMSENNILKILAWLDLSKKPIVILGPKNVLKSLK